MTKIKERLWDKKRRPGLCLDLDIYMGVVPHGFGGSNANQAREVGREGGGARRVREKSDTKGVETVQTGAFRVLTFSTGARRKKNLSAMENVRRLSFLSLRVCLWTQPNGGRRGRERTLLMRETPERLSGVSLLSLCASK